MGALRSITEASIGALTITLAFGCIRLWWYKHRKEPDWPTFSRWWNAEGICVFLPVWIFWIALRA